jgi:hypothetical protein
MSTSTNGAVRGTATPGDCARLWVTLTEEFIPGLRVEIKPRVDAAGEAYVRMELVDYAYLNPDVKEHRSVWAVRDFRSGVYLISYNALFDLLIVGHRTITEYFSSGRDNRPTH